MTLAETNATIAELRDLIETVGTQKKSGPVDEETVFKVRKTLVKLRRCHAKLRAEEKDEQSEVIEKAKELQAARSSFENAEFVESQCQFLVEKFNSAQCPDLDLIAATLPSVEEYTRLHRDEPNFVSHDSDPHQFTLNLLASELEDRERFAAEVLSMKRNEELLRSEIASRQKFLSSLTTRLVDVNKSMDGLRKLFDLSVAVADSKLTNIQSLVGTDLFLIASKFHSFATVDSRMSVLVSEDAQVTVSIGGLTDLPLGVEDTVHLVFSQSPMGELDIIWRPFCPHIFESSSWISDFKESSVQAIRTSFVNTAWNRFEESSLLQAKPPHTALLALISMASLTIPSDCQLASLTKQGETYVGKIKFRSSQIEFTLADGPTVRLVKLPNFVSSKPEAGQMVDIALAQVELDIKAGNQMMPARCPLTHLIVKIMNLV